MNRWKGKVFSAEQYEPEMSRAIEAAKEAGHAEFTASVGENRYLFMSAVLKQMIRCRAL